MAELRSSKLHTAIHRGMKKKTKGFSLSLLLSQGEGKLMQKEQTPGKPETLAYLQSTFPLHCPLSPHTCFHQRSKKTKKERKGERHTGREAGTISVSIRLTSSLSYLLPIDNTGSCSHQLGPLHWYLTPPSLSYSLYCIICNDRYYCYYHLSNMSCI